MANRRAKPALEDHFGRELTLDEGALLARATGGLGDVVTDALVAMVLSEQDTAATGRPVLLLRMEQVLRRTGLGRSKIYSLIAAGLFPAPVRIAGTRVSAWRSDAVDQWIAEQA